MDINFDKNFRPLLLFGCSYTYGQGIHKDKNFPSQLQKYTNRKTYSFADLGMEPDHLLKYLYFINNIQIDYFLANL